MKSKGGSIFKYKARNGERLWRYQFTAEPLDGKRQRFGKAGFSTRAEALAALDIAVKGQHPGPGSGSESVAQWMRIWLRDYAPERVAPKTLERYQELAGYILDATEGESARLAATPLAAVDHKILESALRTIKAKRIDHLSPKTVREVASVIRVALNEAFRLEKIAVNPFARVKLPKPVRREARSLTPEEMARLREACRNDWTFPFVELALATGARRGELLALTWADVDFATYTVTISKSLEELGNIHLRVKQPKSGKSRRFRVGQSAIATLRFLVDQQAEYRRLYGADYHDNNLVFCQPDGSFFHPHKVTQTIGRRLRKAGIKVASLHTCRHSHASNILSQGVPLAAVASRLGHADTNITARIYAHALPDDDGRAAEAWETVRGPVQ